MLFNSLEFAVFFPFTTALFFLTPLAWRWLPLLLMSSVFYMAFVPAYILILLVTIVVDYAAGLIIEGSQGRKRRLFLIVSVLVNVSFLAFFKYWNFLNENLAVLFGTAHLHYPVPLLKIALPIGLSFHIFQSLSYTIEVYRGHQKAERHFGIYALYVMFYPQLVAGPIERPQNLLPQFHAPKPFDAEQAALGLQRMLWGFFKKVVVADRLAAMVDVVYDNPTSYTGAPLIAATLAFTVEIYCDFSGYSDIALGAAQVMGYELMENFSRPYFATSVSEFWSRWHRSLSTWFRDYLYIPLGGNRVSLGLWIRNTVIVFALSGLWHGASWTFVVWGFLHAAFLVTGRLKDRALGDRLVAPRALKWLATVSLVAFAWIFFRAHTLREAHYISTHLFSGLPAQLSSPRSLWVAVRALGQPDDILLAILFTAFLFAVEGLQSRGPLRARLREQPTLVRWGLLYACMFTTILFGVFRHHAFIYFQF